MSNTKKTANNRVSNNNIVVTNNITLSEMDFQLDISEIGAIIVVNNTKYIDKPSTPNLKLK